jgi:hypothetical protein
MGKAVMADNQPDSTMPEQDIATVPDMEPPLPAAGRGMAVRGTPPKFNPNPHEPFWRGYEEEYADKIPKAAPAEAPAAAAAPSIDKTGSEAARAQRIADSLHASVLPGLERAARGSARRYQKVTSALENLSPELSRKVKEAYHYRLMQKGADQLGSLSKGKAAQIQDVLGEEGKPYLQIDQLVKAVRGGKLPKLPPKETQVGNLQSIAHGGSVLGALGAVAGLIHGGGDLSHIAGGYAAGKAAGIGLKAGRKAAWAGAKRLFMDQQTLGKVWNNPAGRQRLLNTLAYGASADPSDRHAIDVVMRSLEQLGGGTAGMEATPEVFEGKKE